MKKHIIFLAVLSLFINCIRSQENEFDTLYAFSYSDIDQTKHLIKQLGDVNKKYVDGKTALYYAVANHNLPAVELLIAHKADPLITYDNRTIVSVAKNELAETAQRRKAMKVAGPKLITKESLKRKMRRSTGFDWWHWEHELQTLDKNKTNAARQDAHQKELAKRKQDKNTYKKIINLLENYILKYPHL